MLNTRARTVGFIVVMLAALDTADCRQKKPGLFSLDETFFMPQFMEQKYENRIIKQKHRTDDSVSPWTEATEPILKPTSVPASFKTCPWTYVIVYNPRRIPDTTLEAVCSTQQCLAPHLKNYTAITEPSLDDVERSQSPYSSILPSKTLCREVRYFRWVKVKSRRIFHGKVKLTRMLLPVTVACSCITVNNPH